MITLLTCASGPAACQIKVMLDIALADITQQPHSIRASFKSAKTAGRKIGCVVRNGCGALYFSYDPASQSQLELSLLTALLAPESQLHITAEAAGG